MSNPHTLVTTAATAMGSPSLSLLDSAAKEYAAKREALVAFVNQRMSLNPDIDRLIGPDNRSIMIENHWNHAKFMLALLHDYRPALLVNTVVWVFKAYRARGFTTAYWDTQLDCWLEVMDRELSADALGVLRPVYRFLQEHTGDFAALAG